MTALDELLAQARAAAAAGDAAEVDRIARSQLLIAAGEQACHQLAARCTEGGKFRSAIGLGEIFGELLTERLQRLSLEARLVAAERRLADVEKTHGLRRAA